MGDLVQARRLGQTLCWALMHQPHLGKIWEYQNGFQFVILFPNCLIFQLSLLGMAYVLFNRRAHLQRLPVLCTIVCRRRQTNQTVNVTRENIAFFKEMIFFIFFYWPDTKAKYLALGWPLWPAALYIGTHNHSAATLRSLQCRLKLVCTVSSFSIWLDSLARSCRRCCCRSAAREGELREDGPLVTQLCRGWDLRYAACLVTRG